MSNIRARLMKPTGLEFYDTAYEIDKEIWNFIKNAYKNKTAGLPARYWQTHAVPLHNECWKMIGKIKKANSIMPPWTEDTCRERRRLQQEAIGHTQTIYELLRLTLNEIEGLDANKLGKACDLLEKETDLLRKWRNATRVDKKNQSPGKA